MMRTKLIVILLLMVTVIYSQILEEGFEGDELPDGWTIIDSDGDFYNWEIYGAYGTSHSGDQSIMSESWSPGGGALTPDNWLISPAIEMPEAISIKWWIATQDSNYPYENYGLYFSTSGTEVTDFTLLFYEELDSSNCLWEEREYILQGWEGETVYLAWRHYNCTDNYKIKLDDILVEESETYIDYPEWVVNPFSYEYSFSMWGVVLLEDLQVDITTGMLGCFVGNECRGVCTQANGTIIDYTNVPEFGHVAFMPMIYSNQTSGETVSFRYFDAETEEVYELSETVFFVANLQIGNGLDPFVWHTQEEMEISKDLVPGWNWFSLNVSANDMTINSVLASVEDNAVNIKNQLHNALFYEGMGWFGSLTELNTTSLYKMEVADPATLTFEGMPVDVSEQVYNLFYGWNWISYAPQLPEDINYAIGMLANGSNIKNQIHNALYYDGMGWFGSLDTLEPLAGYMLEMNEAEQLVYPEPESSIRIAETVNYLSVKKAGWQVNPYDFEYNSVVNAQIISAWVIEPDNYELALFCGDECRGIAEILDYTEPFDGTFHSMMIYSDQSDPENMHFMIYDKVNDKTINPDFSINCQADKTLGDFLNPVKIMLPNGNEEQVPKSCLCNIYPNPFNPETRISFQLAKVEHVKIEVYNIKGQKEEVLLDKQMSAGSQSVVWNAQNHNSGIFFLSFSSGDQHDVKKMILLK